MPTIARTALSLAGITAAFALVLYLAYGSGNGDSSARPTPAPSEAVAGSSAATATPVRGHLPTPTPAPLPPVLADAGVTPMEVGNLVQFPENTALIMETGCWQCDGPSTGLRRMYNDDAFTGGVRVEQLLSLERLGIVDARAYFSGYAIAPDASYMLASVCIRGGCSYALDAWSADARTAVYESTDGGVTWTLLEELDLALSIEGLIAPRLALASWQDQPPPGPRLYATYPGFEPITPPYSNYRDYGPLAISGEVFWTSFREPQLLVRSDGSVVVDLREGTHIRSYQSWTASGGSGTSLLSWGYFPENDQAREFISLVNSFGRTTTTFEMNPPDAWMLSAIWHDGRVFGTMANPPLIGAPAGFLGLLPAVLDLETGRYINIEEPFLQQGYDRQRDIVSAVQSGPEDNPIARVVRVEGSCLNVREAPNVDAEILACAADGVLLSVGFLSDESGEWIEVTAPDGTHGWAATEFLLL